MCAQFALANPYVGGGRRYKCEVANCTSIDVVLQLTHNNVSFCLCSENLVFKGFANEVNLHTILFTAHFPNSS